VLGRKRNPGRVASGPSSTRPCRYMSVRENGIGYGVCFGAETCRKEEAVPSARAYRCTTASVAVHADTYSRRRRIRPAVVAGARLLAEVDRAAGEECNSSRSWGCGRVSVSCRRPWARKPDFPASGPAPTCSDGPKKGRWPSWSAYDEMQAWGELVRCVAMRVRELVPMGSRESEVDAGRVDKAEGANRRLA
jgi:hypothetical protein